MKEEVIKSILSRNGYVLEYEENEVFKIYQSVKGNEFLKSFFILAVTLCIIGLFLLLLGSLWGILILISAIPVFLKVSNQKASFERLSKRRLEIVKGKIEIFEGNSLEHEVFIEAIEGLNYYIEKDENLSRGGIELELAGGAPIRLLEIFGDDKRYVEDDTIKLVGFISEIIN